MGLPNTCDLLSLLAQPYLSPSLSLVVLGKALLEFRAPPPPPHHRAAAGWSLAQPLLLPLLDQGVGDVTGLYVCWTRRCCPFDTRIIGDLDHDEYDSIIPVLLNAVDGVVLAAIQIAEDLI